VEAQASAAEAVLVVTGAASGMGAAAVKLSATRFGVIVALDRDAEQLDRLASEHTGSAGLESIACDITSATEVRDAASRIERQYGRIDALLNFAGVSDFARTEDTTEDVWRRQVEVNLTGTFHACQAFGAVMVRQRSGAIVNVASTAGMFGVPGMAAYTAAKHGVVGLTRALAVEWAPFGVRVNCICPGATLTPMLLGATPEFRAARVKRIPIGRFGEPEEQAAVALFLTSSDAAYVTGAIIPVDGGVAAMAPGTSEQALQP
jgi:meso-butanediol dehydrogenase/(S,S)-butanediol dehydrogenase/diacetyl reductase